MSLTNISLPLRSVSASPKPGIIHASPANFRIKIHKLEQVMRSAAGTAQHGITQIGFGDRAGSTMDMSESPSTNTKLIELNEMDERAAAHIVNAVNSMTMEQQQLNHNHSRNNNGNLTTIIIDTNSNASFAGRKRRSEQVPLKGTIIDHANKRQCMANNYSSTQHQQQPQQRPQHQPMSISHSPNKNHKSHHKNAKNQQTNLQMYMKSGSPPNSKKVVFVHSNINHPRNKPHNTHSDEHSNYFRFKARKNATLSPTIKHEPKTNHYSSVQKNKNTKKNIRNNSSSRRKSTSQQLLRFSSRLNNNNNNNNKNIDNKENENLSMHGNGNHNNNNRNNNHHSEMNEELEMRVNALTKEKYAMNDHLLTLSKEKTNLNLENDQLRAKMSSMTQQLSDSMHTEDALAVSKATNQKACESLLKLLQEITYSEKRAREAQLLADNTLIGKVVQQTNNYQIQDVWEDGQLFTELHRRRRKLQLEKTEVDTKRKQLTKQKRKLQHKRRDKKQSLETGTDDSKHNRDFDSNTTTNASTNNNSRNQSPDVDINNNNNNNINNNGMLILNPNSNHSTNVLLSAMNNNNNNNNNHNHNFNNANANANANIKMINAVCVESEILQIRASNIKKRLQELSIEEVNLQNRKKRHIKFLRLMRDEKRSRFTHADSVFDDEPYVLNERYILTNLLGKGGFSEVHRAYDIAEHKYVACKIHQLNLQWTDERKQNYTKHATREYDIHKSLEHGNIVSLYDVFGIDTNSFCTVLEFCDGMDLDMYLKIHQVLTEKEARSIIIQVFQGLKYLHTRDCNISSNGNNGAIIHYDLKPGNLMYKRGFIKLTDFGLAKIMDQNVTCMELTSQGAGTYWYLPPECFLIGVQNRPIMISPKVDIWSAGVILYQMLCGFRPFGDNQSQDTILRDQTILKARVLSWPTSSASKNRTSMAAKEFIQQCLSYDPESRLSSQQIVDSHPYFSYLRKYN